MVSHRLDGPLGGDTDCILLFIADHAPEANDTMVDNHVDRCHCSCLTSWQDFVRFCDVDESQPRLVSACTRLARLTMPTSRPSFTTGTRLMPCFSRRFSDLLQRRVGINADHLTRHRIFGLAPMCFDKLGISFSAVEKVSSHQERLRLGTRHSAAHKVPPPNHHATVTGNDRTGTDAVRHQRIRNRLYV
jgi:hypothetical protein